MASKFSQFLEQNKIDPRRLIVVSRKIERLRPEDRALKLQKRKGGAESAAAEGEGDGKPAAPAKPRSGRPVTQQLMNRASKGQPVPGPAKQRVLRAVNHILQAKKKDPVDLRQLF